MKRTITIRDREAHEVSTAMDVSNRSEREVDRILSGIYRQVDLEHFEVVDSECEAAS